MEKCLNVYLKIEHLVISKFIRTLWMETPKRLQKKHASAN